MGEVGRKAIKQEQTQETMQIITINAVVTECSENQELNLKAQQDSWLPITESRNGNIYTSSFHILSSGIGFQALLLPFAFASLGWAWGIICLSMAFLWQLYTKWLLVQLHQSTCGTRYSRYIHLSMASFGVKMGKLLCIFPVMYLSGGACVMLIIIGGGTMELFFQTVIWSASSSLNGAFCFLVFTSIAIAVAQLPNLNSLAGVSLVGAITGVSYCTLLWVLSIYKGKIHGITYEPLRATKSEGTPTCTVLNAIGIIALAFRGHNLILEIMGTMPSTPKETTQEKLIWRAVTISYLVIATCTYPLAIVGYWAYGNKMLAYGGILSAFSHFHGNNTSKFIKGMLYLLVVINCVCTFQVYAMPVFDNLESIYIKMKCRRCPSWVRSSLRLLFGGVALLIAMAFPFLGSLAPLIGSIALPLTFACPCFMWIALKAPRRYSSMWFFNLGVGSFGLLLSIVLGGIAVWNLVINGLNANFFDP